jgi:hypothetical protein
VVSGECPRCGHFHQASFSPNIILGGKLRGATTTTATSGDRLSHVVVCDCAGTHHGRPDDIAAGCGLRYLVEFDIDRES